MARIRSLKPELPQDAGLARLSREARYTFLLLITQADDEGYFRASGRLLLGQLYPHDADVTEPLLVRWMDELASIGRVLLFDTDDGPVGYIVNFKKHQKIDHPSRSYLASLSRKPRETFAKGVLSLESLVLSPDLISVGASAQRKATLRPDTKARGYAEEFEAVWSVYPHRVGTNSKREAFKAWSARLREGVEAAQLTAGLARYRAFCEATDKLGTEYVLQARTFFGPARHFEQAWDLPSVEDDAGGANARNLASYRRLLARAEREEDQRDIAFYRARIAECESGAST